MADTRDPHRIRLTGTVPRVPRNVALRPDAETRAAMAAEIGVSAIRKLSLSGELRPIGNRDWELSAILGATVVQPCGVTLEPVTTRIDDPVERRFIAGYDSPQAAEQEMPGDVEDEPLTDMLDLSVVMAEALALAIPAFPRAEGVEPIDADATPPGAEPIRDEDTKPFAGLADALRKATDG
ncbi:hypothetical protein PARPLA_02399 [Rhodobacteraceae bacterium THAF1]|uniref:YceD family protein n=1 Tax=Palleronia sp. THAF1 TaxID=2587842 RepID=UPI000F40B405|nr:DUF177 domain-containing protein [Palleronia sp. THAF1]QFU09209.1 hypothetical protein FIU81_11045 [Palleronia sp. THAF1]VDC27327.1 hypothetical protein PARPLA_02399 [Rhodobacteraceae bacterium THAF1]